MTRFVRACALIAFVIPLIALAGGPAAAAPHLQRATAVLGDEVPSARGGSDFAYDLVQLSPSTQMAPDTTGTAPYFFFLLTNTGTQPDTYHMAVTGVDPIGWFGQVCIGFLCFPDSLDHPLAPAASDSVGVNVVPFTSGVDTFTFTLSSLGNPTLVDMYELTLYAGTDVVDVQPLGTIDVSGYELHQNMPNPVRSTTSIDFDLPRAESVDLRIYDVAGRVVRTLSRGIQAAGPHRLSWDGQDDSGRDLPAGVYFYRLATPEKVLARRLTLIR